jgi:site-specific recombinase XerD
MSEKNFLSVWVKRFLLEYLISVRNLSRNTQHSYRDTFRLILPFLSEQVKKPIDKLEIDNVTQDRVKGFLSHLEFYRKCSVSTRNQRLAAIHAFAHFVGLNSPEHVEWCRQLRTIPFKKSKRTLITYLDKPEMDALLSAPDLSSSQGNRDHALLLFLYNTGARADEAAQSIIQDLSIAHAQKRDISIVTIRGKGNKLRRCPLWQKTAKTLEGFITGRAPSEHVFLNRCGEPLTRFGIHTMVKRYVEKILPQFPSMKQKRVSPHTIRHTTATHLLQSGVDINTIRAWLGHVSINTTNIYAEVDLEMKAKALACCEPEHKAPQKRWRDDHDLMKFLNSI